MEPKWLDWVRQLQAIGQTGLAFTRDPYDRERYEQLLHLAAEIAAEHSGLSHDKLFGLFTAEAGYVTPKIVIRGIVFHDEKMLLVRERSDGGWSLPGGWAEVGLSPAENAVKEIREESGYQTNPVRILGLLDRSRHGHRPVPFSVYQVFIQCDLLEPPTPHDRHMSLETDGVGFFRRTEIPDLSLYRVTHELLIRLFEHHDNPDLLPDFD